MTPTVVALVPMRHVSERVVGKNYRDFNGRPLFHHIVSTLHEVEAVSTIVIDTDSPLVAEQTAMSFPDVVVLARPTHLLGGDVPMTAIIEHDAREVEGEWYLQTHTTNPLLQPATITAALDALWSKPDEHDSLFTVTRLQTRLYDEHGSALNHDPNVLVRTQDLAPVYEENSNLYVFPRRLALDSRRIGDRPLMFEVPALEAVDIDEESDFVIAETLHRLRHGVRS
jgi:CMP-N-acetylneuraminic acid synthetase